MLVLATSTVVTVLIVIAILVVIAVLFVALGPLSRPEQIRDDEAVDAEFEGALQRHAGEDVREAEDIEPRGDPEERLDREYE